MPPLGVDLNCDSYESPEVNSHVQMINDLCFKCFKRANEKGPTTIKFWQGEEGVDFVIFSI